MALVTACREPDPAPATATPVPVSIDELEITDSLMVRDIVAVLSQDEVACLRDAVGTDSFDALQDIFVATAPDSTVDLLFQCLTLENAVGIGVALMSAEALGLSAETRGCISDVAIENPSVLGIGEQTAEPEGAIGPGIHVHLCLTDEEAAALSTGADGELPPPSDLRCMVEELGGFDALEELSSSEEPNPDAAFTLFVAAQACAGTGSALPEDETGGVLPPTGSDN